MTRPGSASPVTAYVFNDDQYLYLAIDDVGVPRLTTVSNSFDSESYWEFKYYFWKDRGYATHTVPEHVL
ncbi:MAG: hypothetical protein MUF50_05105, partial [Planctomycetes bacterium]|nr:hypothetical protein [Planctomycetota bacterium]